MKKKMISIVTTCFNEEENIVHVYEKIKTEFANLKKYNYEHIIIDNCSSDNTPLLLEQISAKDKNVKVIFNAKNFGQARSFYHALNQTSGNAVIPFAADFQDPPEMIKLFIEKWEEGYKTVIAVKSNSEETRLMYFFRQIYYKLMSFLSEVKTINNFSGFGLYDIVIIDAIKQINDPYPYFRTLIFEIGYEPAVIKYVQPKRKKGKTKYNFYQLFDHAMLGITSNSKIPLRIATISGFISSIIFLLIALRYFIYKLLYWDSFSIGISALTVGLFFIGSVLLFFIGILGEYMAVIYAKINRRPFVFEKRRINFDK